jgi:hypothetical protein
VDGDAGIGGVLVMVAPVVSHPVRDQIDAGGGWVGVDRGLSAFLVAADAAGREVARVTARPIMSITSNPGPSSMQAG